MGHFTFVLCTCLQNIGALLCYKSQSDTDAIELGPGFGAFFVHSRSAKLVLVNAPNRKETLPIAGLTSKYHCEIQAG